MSSYITVQMAGWIQTLSDGVATMRLALAEEGMTTAPTDTPANVQFKPAILNADSFSIRRAPQAWYEGDSDGGEAAAYSSIQIYNGDGTWDALVKKNLEDTPIIVQLPDAQALTTGTALASSLTILTGILGKPTEDEQRIITLPIRDVITRLDKALPVRFIPGFRDAGAAGNMVPLTYGAFRNRKPLLVDAEKLIYLLHDEAVGNILKVTDMAAPLDPHANPPQYTPALNGCGVQLTNPPAGEVRIDGTSNGTQSTIPGVADVLNGDGKFLGTWTGSPATPPNWSWTHAAGSSIGKLVNPPYAYLGSTNGVRLLSAKVWNPNGGFYSDQFTHPYALIAGATYRVSFALANVQSESPYFQGGMQGGLILATQLSKNAIDYITGMNTPLVATGFQPQRLTFEFTVPPGGSRILYFIVAPSAGNAPNNAQGVTSLELDDITLELVGQFVDQPATPLPFSDYVRKILVDHCGESASIFNAAEAAQVFKRTDGTLKPWGVSFNAPPNVIHDCLAKPAKSDGYVIITDSLGTLRFRRQLDPRDPANQGVIKCDFTRFNMSRPVISDDIADALTTEFGTRPNQDPYSSDSDFVTDTATVSLDQRTRYKRASQFWAKSSFIPLPQFAGSANAPRFETVFDEDEDGVEEVNRIVGQFAARRYSNTSISTDKRQRLTFTATFDDPRKLGITTTCAVPDLLYGDMVYIDYDDVELDPAGNVIKVLRTIQCYASIVITDPRYFTNQIQLVVRI
jgi:hypothetical protein